MRTGLKVLAISVMLTFALSTLAADAPHATASKTWKVSLPTAMKVGGVLLPAGDYKVQSLTEGEDHIMVFKTQGNKEKARAGCKLEKLDKKADQTVLVSNLDGDGQRVLESISFKGDTFRHQLVNR
jgi:hypothetical protein